MSSREEILAKVKLNQPAKVELPTLDFQDLNKDLLESFKAVLASIGGEVIEINSLEEIKNYVLNQARENAFLYSEVNGIDFGTKGDLKDLDFLLIESDLGVAENAACWVVSKSERVAPFITQYLGIVIKKKNLVGTMHEAYNVISDRDYGFGVFIAGPSKTADIEQSLVLGAHGARGLSVFVVNE